jgi:hypothetical protein
MERRGDLKGLQTSIRLGGCMGMIYSPCDVQGFHAMVIIRCEEIE